MTAKTAADIIATATGGRDAWDSEVLREVAESALKGIPAERIAGRPTDSEEFAAFAVAVSEIQETT